MRIRSPWWCVSCLALAAACGGPSVRTSDALPLRQVVLHRNGVAYFARAGRFDGDALVFHVRRRDVGDFLASLAAVERGRGRVESVSFEVEEPEPPREGEPPRDPGDDMVDVRLRFSDRSHDLTVSYVVAAPIWKPTYRLVLGEGDEALLQAWAVVQNVTGEDWDDVRLALTTGTPIAFESDLATPVTPPRPFVTDQGDVVQAVPEAEVAYAAPPPPPASAPAPMEDQALELEEGDAVGGAGAAVRSRRAAPSGAAAEGFVGGFEGPGDAAKSVVVAATATTLAEGVTRYDLDEGVTVPDGGSTMVAIASAQVPGEAAHLFAPEPGVPESSRHPFRVARLRNASGASLERGPITVYGRGGFLGQGLLPSMPREATTFVPFALDRTLAVEASTESGYAGAALVRIVDGRVTVDRYEGWKTRYEVRHGGADPTRLWVRHPRRPGAELHDPPEGTEPVPGAALVPVPVPAHETVTVVVEERTRVRRDVDVLSPAFADAVLLYLEGDPDERVAPALREALEHQRALVDAQRRISELERQRAEVRQTAAETRASLEALRRVERADDLRARLVRRLEEADRRDGELTREIVELQARESELRVRLREAIAEVRLEQTPAAAEGR